MANLSASTGDLGATEFVPRGLRGSSHYLYPIIATLVLFAVWELAPRYGNVSPLILPAPSAILKTAIDKFPLLMHMSTITIYEFVLGF